MHVLYPLLCVRAKPLVGPRINGSSMAMDESAGRGCPNTSIISRQLRTYPQRTVKLQRSVIPKLYLKKSYDYQSE